MNVNCQTLLLYMELGLDIWRYHCFIKYPRQHRHHHTARANTTSDIMALRFSLEIVIMLNSVSLRLVLLVSTNPYEQSKSRSVCSSTDTAYDSCGTILTGVFEQNKWTYLNYAQTSNVNGHLLHATTYPVVLFDVTCLQRHSSRRIHISLVSKLFPVDRCIILLDLRLVITLNSYLKFCCKEL